MGWRGPWARGHQIQSCNGARPTALTRTLGQMLSAPGNALIVTAVQDDARSVKLMRENVMVSVQPAWQGQVDLTALMQMLAAEHEINEVLVEAGPTLNGALLNAGLIDEVIIYMAPHLMGDAARGLFHLPGLQQMSQRIVLDIQDVRAVGCDWRISAKIVRNN